MKLIKLEIVGDMKLEITLKKPIFKSYLEKIHKLEQNLHARDLGYKYLGWHFDENKNIVMNFRLLDATKDIIPYTKGKKK